MATLNEWNTVFLRLIRNEVSESHYRNYTLTVAYLVELIGGDTALADITPADADDWRAHLRGQYAEATVCGHIRRARTLFRRAVLRGLIDHSPFNDIPAGSFYVDREPIKINAADIAALIEFAPTRGWKFWIGLCAYAGLRKSEARRVRWADIEHDAGKLYVRNTGKRTTKRKTREVRLEPELAGMIRRMRHNGEFLVDAPKGNEHRVLHRIYTQAGIKHPKGLFQELRRWRDVSWKVEFPEFAVDKWLGHSLVVSRQHYVTVPEDLYSGTGSVLTNQAQAPQAQAAPVEAKPLAIAHTPPISRPHADGGCTIKFSGGSLTFSPPVSWE